MQACQSYLSLSLSLSFYLSRSLSCSPSDALYTHLTYPLSHTLSLPFQVSQRALPGARLTTLPGSSSAPAEAEHVARGGSEERGSLFEAEAESAES